MIRNSISIMGMFGVDVWFFLEVGQTKQVEIVIKQQKEKIYEIFENFPESKHIDYTVYNLYCKTSIEPAIYQIDILAELTDDAYVDFITQAEFEN